MAVVSAIASMAGKVQNVKCEVLNASLPIAPDMDNAEKEFAFVTQDGLESTAKHVSISLLTKPSKTQCHMIIF